MVGVTQFGGGGRAYLDGAESPSMCSWLFERVVRPESQDVTSCMHVAVGGSTRAGVGQAVPNGRRQEHLHGEL